ncbi:hypothetical protein NBRC110019_15580 [Neptunitalea chrysea]|uniref:ATP synthase F1 complex delta/epsilon subunit N-terminal domain-containing protein n=1 Tax=Neptunitalea chrysea TaxID=1647581 RepID=A0A9W6B4J4_9FLAO|nr:F0F1 ATP synthase subunit epsilon [Neptunitalea chrysea]GLB52518.1 hypothetical protein NBRC110019_15580 [Neptunitalea chrysea]
MILEIVTPEATLFEGQVEAVTVPGLNGEFQILNNHAAIVSILGKGTIKIKGNITIDEAFKAKFGADNGATTLAISSGTIEMNDNKIIVLAD